MTDTMPAWDGRPENPDLGLCLTTAEAVERMARAHDLVRFTLGMRAPEHDLTAATLRALLAERDAAQQRVNEVRGQRDEAIATLTLYRAEHGCTRGQRTTQWCAEASAAHQERDARVAEARREGIAEAAEIAEAMQEALERAALRERVSKVHLRYPYEEQAETAGEIAAAIRAAANAKEPGNE